MIGVDILIVGAGVAGSVAALTLSRQGYRVAVIERNLPRSSSIGECLPPRVKPALRLLGLEDAFLADNHLSMQGYCVSWDKSGQYERDFLRSPYGCGWLLNRKRFDQMLVNAGMESGGLYHWQTKLINITQNETNPHWQIECLTDKQPVYFTAKALVDASGRSRSVARRLGGKSRRDDNLIAFVSRVDHTQCHTLPPQDVLIESSANGWWYSAPFSSKYSTLCYFTDGDLPIPKNSNTLLDWSLQLPNMKRRLLGAIIPKYEPLIRTAAYTSALEACVGNRWIAIGDAACSFDPLSSYGITSALGSGYYGAAALAGELKGKPNQLASYQTLMQRTFLEFLEQRFTEYQKVDQFDSTFWQRRSANGGLLTPRHINLNR